MLRITIAAGASGFKLSFMIAPHTLIIVTMPLIGALIGWLTNRIAIQMLFRPRKPMRFLGCTWQGLIPRRQGEIAIKTGEIVENEILQRHVIGDELRKMDVQSHLKEFTRQMIYTRLGPRLKEIPLLGGFVNERIMAKLEDMAQEAVADEIPMLLDKLATEAEKRIAIRHLVETRVNSFDLDTLERLIRELAQKEFHRIELLGALLGCIIGFMQASLLAMSALV